MSHDHDHRWAYVPDGTNNVIWILDRESMEVVNHFGRGGRLPGEFSWLHNLDVDSRGNLYTAEVLDGHRVQRFRLID